MRREKILDNDVKNRVKENKSKGFVVLYRSLLDWEYTDDDAVFSCFVKILMAVNYQTKRWHGQEIKRGSIVGSIETLCSKLRIKKDTLRRCLKLLSECEAIKVDVIPNKYHIITVTNYSRYQDIVDGKTANKTVYIADNKTVKSPRKKSDNTADNKTDTTKQYNNINKETRCVCHKGTHTPEKKKTTASPPVTPLGGARAGEHSEILNMSDASGEASMATKRECVMSAGTRPQANSAQHYQEQDSSPHRSSDVNPTVMSAGTRPQVNSAQHYQEQDSSPHRSSDVNPTVMSAGARPQADDKGETPAVTKDLTRREWRVYCELKGHNEFEAADFWIKQKGVFDEVQKRRVREFLKANGEA